MKCNRCGEYVETAGDVRNCKQGCAQDGTASQITDDVSNETLVKELISIRPGLGNRFLPGSAPTEGETVPTEIPTEKEGKPKRKKKPKS